MFPTGKAAVQNGRVGVTKVTKHEKSARRGEDTMRVISVSNSLIFIKKEERR
jgi:hypothetical protein